MRVTRILSVLAVAWLASGVKDHVAALNETSHHSPDQPIENEVSLDSGETTTDHHHHPHQTVPGKPTKLDVNVNQIVQTDDRSRYLAEATDPNNSTSPVSRGGEEEEEEGRKEGIVRLVLGDDPPANASRIMLGSGDGRKGEKGKEERRPDAREHVVKMIRGLRKDLVAGRKARNFLNGESA